MPGTSQPGSSGYAGVHQRQPICGGRASGATSQGYSISAAIFLAIVLVVAGPLLEVIPQAALGALVVYAAIPLIDVAGFRRLWRFRRSEFWLAIVTTTGVLVFGVLYGVLIAVALSVLVLLVDVARPHSAALGFVPELAGMHDIGDFDNVEEEPGLLIFRFDSPPFFANAQYFPDASPPDDLRAGCAAAVVRAAGRGNSRHRLDGAGGAGGAGRRAGSRGYPLRAGPRQERVGGSPRAHRFIDVVGRDYIFPTLPTLVAAFREAR